MKKQIMKFKYYVLGCVFLILGGHSYAQVGFGTNNPNPYADMTLGSENKGLLLNRVKLTSLNSAAPLKQESMAVGTMVFNTTVNQELQEGVYFWTKEKKWSRLYVKTTPTRDMQFVVFKQTSKTYSLPFKPATLDITDLNYDYKAEEDGLLFLDYVIYGYIVGGVVKAGNTFCYTTVTDDSNNQVFSGVTAISPYIVIDYQGKNSSFGLSSFVFPVKKGKVYKIRMKGHETFADTYTDMFTDNGKYDIRIGDFSFSGQTSHSSLKVTFMSDPSL
ncbi:MAG: hypothetical protein LBE34_00415 [Flavobacteriaceae bacterium]|jgi:hypothetical protein|nr:hypothetical protein [Flavobacteriaceae bacterium]